MKNKIMFDISENMNTIVDNMSLAKSLVKYMDAELNEKIGYCCNDIFNLIGLVTEKIESLENKFNLIEEEFYR